MDPDWLLALKGAKEVVVTAAAATGAVLAWLGLGAWKRQLRGRSEYELAIRFLRAVYGVRDAIGAVRAPFMSASEIASALEQEASGSSGDDQGDGEAAAYSVRWKAVREAASTLQVAGLEAEVHWGDTPRALQRPLLTCVNELNWAVSNRLRRKSKVGYMESTSQLSEQADSIVYAISDHSPFDKQLREAVKALEDFARERITP